MVAMPRTSRTPRVSTNVLIPALYASLRAPEGKQWARAHGLEPSADRLVREYANLNERERTRRFGRAFSLAERDPRSVGELLVSSVSTAAALATESLQRESRARNALRKKLRALSLAEVLQIKPKSVDEEEQIRKYLCEAISDCSCCAGSEVPEAKDPPREPKYGLKLRTIECQDKQDLWLGKDEVYARYVVVDGLGKINTGTTAIYSMDNGDVRRVERYIYGMNNPKGFLDATVELIEDDTEGKGKDEAEKALSAVASTVSKAAGGNVYAQIAAGVLQVAAAIVAGVQPKDDILGTRSITKTSSEALHASVGTGISRTFSSTGGDAIGETSSRYRLRFSIYETA